MIRTIAAMNVEEGNFEAEAFAEGDLLIFADWLKAHGRAEDAGRIREALRLFKRPGNRGPAGAREDLAPIFGIDTLRDA